MRKIQLEKKGRRNKQRVNAQPQGQRGGERIERVDVLNLIISKEGETQKRSGHKDSPHLMI